MEIESLFQRETPTGSLSLTEHEGNCLKELIEQHYHHGFISYCEKVGISANNFYASLRGQRKVSAEWLNKLLSGIGYEVKCYTEFAIQPFETGPIVQDVDYPELEGGSVYDEIVETESESTFSSSEKLPEKPKTLLESLSSATQEESSTSPLPESNTPSPTSLPTPFAVNRKT